MYANSGTNYIPRTKNWNNMGTQTANMSTVSTTFPSMNIGFSVNRFFELLQSMWNPFSFAKNQTKLLETHLEVFKNTGSALAGDVSLIFDLLTQSQLFPAETEDTKFGYSFPKSLKLNSCATRTFEGIPLSPTLLNSISCDLVLNPSNFSPHHKLQRCIIPSETKMENVLIIKNLHIAENMHKSKVFESWQEMALCPYRPVSCDDKTCIVNMQTELHVLPEASVSKSPAPKVKDNSINILNQELVTRKSKKIKKVSRKRRRRQKKKAVKSELKIPNSLASHSYDDFQIIFDEPASPKSTNSILNDSVSSDDFYIGFSYNGTKIKSFNCTSSIVSESEDESNDFCVEFSYDETEVKPVFDHVLSVVSEPELNSESGDDSNLNESIDDFCIEFSYEETDVKPFVNHAWSTVSKSGHNSESDDFCIEFEDEVDCSFVRTRFSSESEDGSDLNNSYDNVEMDDLSFGVETCFISGLTSICTSLASSSTCGKNYLPEMSEELKMVNEQWEKKILNVPSNTTSRAVTKKVSFACDQELVSIYSVEVYERKGEWEIYALERFRFKQRINDMEKVLSPCLSKSHRDNVWLRLQSNSI